MSDSLDSDNQRAGGDEIEAYLARPAGTPAAAGWS